MRTLALLLLIPAWVVAQPKLTAPRFTPRDEADIRAAIREQAKIDSERKTGEIWGEHGPVVYRVRSVEPVTDQVATAEAAGIRTGTFPEQLDYLFILTRGSGRWVVVRRFQVCRPVGFVPVTGLPETPGPRAAGDAK